jgi:hypothetical protein
MDAFRYDSSLNVSPSWYTTHSSASYSGVGKRQMQKQVVACVVSKVGHCRRDEAKIISVCCGQYAMYILEQNHLGSRDHFTAS